jgi:hypothetical protein
MSSDVLAVRFPDRETEYVFGTRLEVGDTLTRGDTEWVVTALEPDRAGQTVATVRPADVQAHTLVEPDD